MKNRSERATSSGPSRCVDVLHRTLEGLGLGRVIHYISLLRAWERAIDPRVRKRATVEDFRDGRLYVSVEDPIWLHELHMLRRKLKTILNQEVGESAVEEIVLRIGPPARAAALRPAPRRPEKKRLVATGAEARIQELLAPLKEVPCHDALARLLSRWAARSI